MPLHDFLGTAGYNLFTYASATKFLINFNTEITGCVVPDARMPGVPGAELAEKGTICGQNLSIIFTTDDDKPETNWKAREKNAVGFLRKPSFVTVMLDAINWSLKSTSS